MPNDEWITPPEYIEPARALFGGIIDLDPASNDLANKHIVKATDYFVNDDRGGGLAYVWHGSVWLNPPYSPFLIKAFVESLISYYQNREVYQAVVLVNTATETGWYKALAKRYPMLFTNTRIRFLQAEQRALDEGAPLKPVYIGGRVFYRGDQNRVGQTLFYLGSNPRGFYRAYNHLGYGPTGTVQAILKTGA